MLTRTGRGEVLWQPSPEHLASARMTRYLTGLHAAGHIPDSDYRSGWEWSVRNPAAFWASVWDHFDVLHSSRGDVVLEGAQIPDVHWFPSARLNYAENVLRWRGCRPAVIGWDESGRDDRTSWDELRELVRRCAAGLRALGVGRGDRVAGYLPNVPEALVAMLAAATIGAIWTCCPPEFGPDAVLDRLRQVEPKVLVAVDGYRYRGREYERAAVVDRLRSDLPSVEVIVWVSRLGRRGPVGALTWDGLLRNDDSLEFEQLPFEHPLWILYSSGTTGLPKPIIHGHGGIVLEHLKSLALQVNLNEHSVAFQYASSGWVMWNIHVGSLLTGATVVLYDGAADYPDEANLWRRVAAAGIDAFGTSPPFLAASAAAGLHPGAEFDLSSLQTIGSTGSPLSPQLFRWVYEKVAADLLLRSTSGGTDVCTSIMGCCPLLPVRAGEIQCRPLGVDAVAFGQHGAPVYGSPGELVVRSPMPSMPVGFWNDRDRSRLMAAYFEEFPGVWRHGDWVTMYEDGAGVVHGRSDATLKRGGIRIGTAEIYLRLDAVRWVRDSVVIEVPHGDATRLVLLVATADGRPVDRKRRQELRDLIRMQLSPRHVPDVIEGVTDLPRTLNGKRIEIPIKGIVTGAAIEDVVSPDAIDRFSALEEIARLRSTLFRDLP